MVRQVRMTPPERTEAEVEPELTTLDQLTPEERRRIEQRKAGPARHRPPRIEPAPVAKTGDVEMTRRSWYAEKAASDALAQAVDDLHFATRQPKHAIVSALFRFAAEHQRMALGSLYRSEEPHP